MTTTYSDLQNYMKMPCSLLDQIRDTAKQVARATRRPRATTTVTEAYGLFDRQTRQVQQVADYWVLATAKYDEYFPCRRAGTYEETYENRYFYCLGATGTLFSFIEEDYAFLTGNPEWSPDRWVEAKKNQKSQRIAFERTGSTYQSLDAFLAQFDFTAQWSRSTRSENSGHGNVVDMLNLYDYWNSPLYDVALIRLNDTKGLGLLTTLRAMLNS